MPTDGGGQSGRSSKGQPDDRPAQRTFASNRRAFYEYEIVDSVEAGIALTGTEIKSVRAGKVNLRDSYARVQNGEVLLYNMHVSPYEQGNIWNHEPLRTRKLLLHRKEIGRLAEQSQAQGLTLVPLRMYAKGGHAKVEIAVARGKKQYDKRVAIAERESKRELDRAVKEAYAGGR
ncbi:MAG: SsrA-binding protein SmpB [Chloroflexi bacterium]|nr:SsrA-binding protein SmpB [Chloroflexota bacterium]